MDIPGFDVVEQLGEGTTGTVWRAYQLSLNRPVALKVLKPGITTRPEYLKRIVEIARRASSVKHPDLVQILDMGVVDGRPYFVSEYVTGQSVAEIVAGHGPLETGQVLKITRHVAEALESAWRLYNLPHHDLKPENLMLDEDGTVKVLDLGLSLVAHPELLAEQIKSGEMEAAPHFLSPEQARCAHDQDYRSDIYSLGALMYYMLTGARPFSERDAVTVLHMHVSGHLANPSDLAPSVPPGVSMLIGRMMMKDPSARPVDWAAVVHQVRRLEAGALDIRERPYEGSTVLPPEAARRSAPTETAGTGKPARVSAPAARPSVPAWFRRTAWLLLAAWFGLLTWALVDPGALSSVVGPLQRRRPSSGLATSMESAAPQALPERPAEAPPAAGEARPERRATQPELADLRADVADALCAGNNLQALRLVEEELRMPQSAAAVEELDEIRDILIGVSKTEASVRAGAHESIGRELPLHIRGLQTTVELRAVAGDRLTGYSKTRRGLQVITNEISFAMSDLSPADLALLTGPAGTPDKCAVKYLLHLRARDHETARTYAENCGPLSEELKRQADAGRVFGE